MGTLSASGESGELLAGCIAPVVTHGACPLLLRAVLAPGRKVLRGDVREVHLVRVVPQLPFHDVNGQLHTGVVEKVTSLQYYTRFFFRTFL